MNKDNKLQRLLAKRKMKQVELCREVTKAGYDIAQSTVYRCIRTGEGNLNTWIAIAKVLGVNVGDIAD